MPTEFSPAPAQAEATRSRYGSYQYQHQTLTLHNTLGLVVVSALAFILLVALLRQQARYQEFVEKLARQP